MTDRRDGARAGKTPRPHEFHIRRQAALGDHTVFRLAGLLVAERQRRGTRNGTRNGTRALSPPEQAVMVPRWFCDGTRTSRLFKDHEVSRSVGYRYLHEAIAVLAWQAPDLRTARLCCVRPGQAFMLSPGMIR